MYESGRNISGLSLHVQLEKIWPGSFSLPLIRHGGSIYTLTHTFSTPRIETRERTSGMREHKGRGREPRRAINELAGAAHHVKFAEACEVKVSEVAIDVGALRPTLLSLKHRLFPAKFYAARLGLLEHANVDISAM